MITRNDIIKDLTDWKAGKMGWRALMDAIDRYAEQSNSHKPVVMQAEGSDGRWEAKQSAGSVCPHMITYVDEENFQRCQKCDEIVD